MVSAFVFVSHVGSVCGHVAYDVAIVVAAHWVMRAWEKWQRKPT